MRSCSHEMHVQFGIVSVSCVSTCIAVHISRKGVIIAERQNALDDGAGVVGAVACNIVGLSKPFNRSVIYGLAPPSAAFMIRIVY